MSDPEAARQKVLDALTSLIETLPDGPERAALLRFLAGNPTLKAIVNYLSVGIERTEREAGRRPIN